MSQTCDQLISPGCLLGELTVHLALNIKLLLCFTLVKSTQLIWSEKDLSWFSVTLPALYQCMSRIKEIDRVGNASGTGSLITVTFAVRVILSGYEPDISSQLMSLG